YNALKDRDGTVRQAALHAVSLPGERAGLPALLDLLNCTSPHNQRAAAEALGRMRDRKAVAALLAVNPADRFLEHSLTYALIEIGDAKATRAGLASLSAATRRMALTALDQMANGGLQVADVTVELSPPDPALRETARRI